MDWIKFASTALVVGVIAPLFWLAVNVLENKLQAKGFPLANFRPFSPSSWRALIARLRERKQRHRRTQRDLLE